MASDDTFDVEDVACPLPDLLDLGAHFEEKKMYKTHFQGTYGDCTG